MPNPPALAEAAIVGATSELVNRIEIYEANGTTRWKSGANDDRLVDGSVNVDYSRDERRSFELMLDNEDFELEHSPDAFWYDKIIKIFKGVTYTALQDQTRQEVRTNYWTNPDFAATGSAFAARKNLYPNPKFVDSNADGTAEGVNNYVSNSATGTRTYPGDTTTFSNVTLPAGTSRFGVSAVINVTPSATQLRTVSVDFTLTGAAANKRVMLYIDCQDASNVLVPGMTQQAGSTAPGGRLVAKVPANVNIAKMIVYLWIDTTDAAGATGLGGSFGRVLVEDSGIELPYFDGTEKPKERINLHKNSLCTIANTSFWYSNNGANYSFALDTTTPTPFGGASMQATRNEAALNKYQMSMYSHNGSLDGWRINAGESATTSVYIYTEVEGRKAYFYHQWRSMAPANLTNSAAAQEAAAIDLIPGQWTRVWVTEVAPAGAAAFYPVGMLFSADGSQIPVGETSNWTAMQIEKTPYLRDFFHPYLPAPSGFSAMWLGAVGSTETYLVQNDPTVAWAGTANNSISEFRFIPPLNVTGLYGWNNTLRVSQTGGTLTPYSARVWVYGGQIGAGSLSAYQLNNATAFPGERWSMRLRARTVQSNGRDLTISARLTNYAGAYLGYVSDPVPVVLPQDGSWVDIPIPSVMENMASTTSVRWLFYPGGVDLQENEAYEFEAITLEKTPTPGTYISGNIQDFGNRDFGFTGAVNNSASTETRTIIDRVPVETTWETQVGEFMIDQISEEHFPYTVKVTGRDYAKKCMLSKFATATSFAKGQSIEATVKAMAANAGITKFNIPLTGRVLGKDYSFERGTSRWEAMKEVADSFGYEIFFDAQGYLVMRDYRDPVTAPLSYTLATGPIVGNLVSYGKTVNDNRIYNKIVVTGESSDSEVIPVAAVAENHVPGSPTSIEKLGERIYQYTSAFIVTQQQAQDVADKFLGLHALEEFELNFSSIALFWLEVGEIIEFIDPRPSEGQPSRFLLSSLNIPLGLGAMDGNAKRVSVVG